MNRCVLIIIQGSLSHCDQQLLTKALICSTPYPQYYQEMKNADFNSIDDLLASELFRKWIIDKDEEAAIFWSQWLEQNPARL